MSRFIRTIRTIRTTLKRSTLPITLALGAAFSTAALADEMGNIVVTATRFPEAATALASNITVITRTDIERTPARSIPDLLKNVAGLDVRALYGSMGIDTGVDIRGSGETAGSNALILLDGQRLNPVDMGGIKWETLPLSTIRQIEIVRGSSSVLHGDRAVNGVINIITDKSDKLRATLKAEGGSHGYLALDASLAGGAEGWYGNVFAHDARTDGWRQNSDAEQTSAGGRVARRVASGEAFLDVSTYREQYGLPGSISRALFESDPQRAQTPNYRMEREGYRLRPGGSFKPAADISLEVDGSYSDDLFKAKNPDWFMRNESHVKSVSFSPRVKWAHGLPGAERSETIAGFDAYDGEAIGDSLDLTTGARYSRQTGEQQSQGVYVENRAQWQGGFDTTVGLRRQHFEQAVSDDGAGLHAEGSDDLTAWEFIAGWRFAPGWRVYGKAARNFRLPNTDELFAYDEVTYQAIFNGALKAQTGRLAELGLSWSNGSVTQQFSLFQQENHNEIGYIAVNGRNANLDPTRRRGAEWEGRWNIDRAWQLRGSLSAVDAEFTEGAYSGKKMPLVPRHKETLGVVWDGAQFGTHSMNFVNVDGRYFGGDFVNARNKLGGYTTVDYQAQWRIGQFAVIFKATNLTDRKYSALGYSSAWNPGTYYPADPRSLSLAVKADLF